MAQYVIYYEASPVSGLLAALIPSVPASFAAFGFLAGIPNAFTRALPFAASLVMRLRPFTFVYKPLFREAEMRGTFFAPIVIWFLALGPVFLVLFFFGWKLPKDRLRNYLFAATGPFLILQFIREGLDHWANAVAIAAIALPFAIVFFTELLRRYINWTQDPEYKGAAAYIVTATVAFLLFGGYICLTRIAKAPTEFFSPEDTELAGWIRKTVPADAIILVKSRELHPVLLTGRQQVLADRALVWNIGFNISNKLEQIDLLLKTVRTDDFKQRGIKYFVEEAGFQTSGINAQTLHQNNKYKLQRIA
jgi:hypothetical protein